MKDSSSYFEEYLCIPASHLSSSELAQKISDIEQCRITVYDYLCFWLGGDELSKWGVLFVACSIPDVCPEYWQVTGDTDCLFLD